MPTVYSASISNTRKGSSEHGAPRPGCWQLLLARFGVGIGEAGGTPPSTSMLADKFPPARRPMAHTIFALGACLGAWLGSQGAREAAERGGSVATFWSWGLMWWTPPFLQRSHHMTVGQAGQLLGPMHLIAGTAGTLLAAGLLARTGGAR